MYPDRHWTEAMNKHAERIQRIIDQYHRDENNASRAKREADKMASRHGPDHAATKVAINKAEAAERKAGQPYRRIHAARADARKALIKVIKPKKAAKIEAVNAPDPAIAQSVDEGKQFVGQILSSSVCPNLSIEFEVRRRGRISRSFGGRVTLPPTAEPGTVVHELGHEIEDQPGVKKATAAFLKWRCGKEKATTIREVFPDATEFPKKIKGRKDDFDRYFEGPDAYYVGRKYKDGSTEIISKGLEAMYDDPAGFAKADPDYFDFIVDILAGNTHERQVSG